MERKTKSLKPVRHQGIIYEYLRRLQKVGIVELIILFLLLLGHLYVQISQRPYWREPDLHIAIESFGFIFAVVVIGSVVMLIKLFKFQINRNTSDFYHSLPVTRRKMFLSTVASVFLWQAVVVAFGYMMVIIAGIGYPNDIRVNGMSLLRGAGFFIITLIYISGIVGLAFSLAGTYSTFFVIAVILLGYVRTISANLLYYVKRIEIFDLTKWKEESFDYLFNGVNNILLRDVIRFLEQESNGSKITINQSLYLIAVSLILFVAAMIGFEKRKSESAGKTYSYLWLDTIIRFLVCFILNLFLVTTVDIFLVDISYGRVTDFQPIKAVTYVLITLIPMLVYEAILYKKTHIKTVLSNLVLNYVIIFIFMMVMTGILRERVAYVPEPSKVEKVKIEVNFEDIETSNPEVIKMMCDALERESREVLNHEYNYREYWTKVTFYTKEEVKREIYLTDKEYERLIQ